MATAPIPPAHRGHYVRLARMMNHVAILLRRLGWERHRLEIRWIGKAFLATARSGYVCDPVITMATLQPIPPSTSRPICYYADNVAFVRGFIRAARLCNHMAIMLRRMGQPVAAELMTNYRDDFYFEAWSPI